MIRDEKYIEEEGEEEEYPNGVVFEIVQGSMCLSYISTSVSYNVRIRMRGLNIGKRRRRYY